MTESNRQAAALAALCITRTSIDDARTEARREYAGTLDEADRFATWTLIEAYGKALDQVDVALALVTDAQGGDVEAAEVLAGILTGDVDDLDDQAPAAPRPAFVDDLLAEAARSRALLNPFGARPQGRNQAAS